MSLKNIIWSSYRLVSSLYFSIGLFIFLAFLSIFGTIIEQEQILDYYKLHYPDSQPVLFFITWQRIIWLGLDHMYSTYWFLGVLVLFFFSLLFCTLSTQLPILKHSRQWNFLYNQQSLETKDNYYKIDPASFMNLVYLLNRNNYFIFHKGKALYGYRGLIGRIAPIFVHISMIVAFIGFILRMTSGLVIQEIVPSNEIFHLQNVVTSGYFSSLPSNFIGKVDDFFITFNKDKSIKQFFSNISFLDNNQNILSSKYIWVNLPMKFEGLTVYQTDWEVNALRVQVGLNHFIVKKLKQINLTNGEAQYAWSSELILDEDHSIFLVIPASLDSLLLYDKQGIFISSTTYGIWNVIYGVPVLFKDLMVSTGLQIKTDPGLIMSYLGFFILIISIVLSYISYSQIWANQNIGQLTFCGSTNRALLSFEKEVSRIFRQMQSLS